MNYIGWCPFIIYLHLFSVFSRLTSAHEIASSLEEVFIQAFAAINNKYVLHSMLLTYREPACCKEENSYFVWEKIVFLSLCQFGSLIPPIWFPLMHGCSH